jgi:hypothetical protein
MISTDHLRVVAISAAISSRLSFQVFSFIVWIETQSIEEGEPSPVTEIEILAPNSTLHLALSRTIGLIWAWQRLTI